LISPAHPLLPVALDCLKNRERERPSAQELCHHLAALKEAPQYGESVQQAQRVTTDGENVRIRELQAEAQERQRQLREKDRTIATQERQLQEKDCTMERQLQEKDHTMERQLQEKDRTMERLLEEKDRTIATQERQLQDKDRTIATKERQLQEKDHTIATKERQLLEKDHIIATKEKLLEEKDRTIVAKVLVRGEGARKGPLCLQWSKCGRAPCEMSRPSCVVDGNMAYFRKSGSKDMYSYNSEKQTWSSLPQCPYMSCSLAVVNGLLTTIGGYITNQLFSLTGERKWVEHFPPMPTKSQGAAAVCSGKSLVVAGGCNNHPNYLNTVEVMDTETLQWSTASSLPMALGYASATISQDYMYLLGHNTSNKRSVLACSMVDLLKSCRSQSLGAWLKSLTLQAVWHQVADLPVCYSSCATLCGQLLVVGGCDDRFRNISTAIHQYNPATNSWEVISHMPTARSSAPVAVLPGNKLMVVGGSQVVVLKLMKWKSPPFKNRIYSDVLE